MVLISPLRNRLLQKKFNIMFPIQFFPSLYFSKIHFFKRFYQQKSNATRWCSSGSAFVFRLQPPEAGSGRVGAMPEQRVERLGAGRMAIDGPPRKLFGWNFFFLLINRIFF